MKFVVAAFCLALSSPAFADESWSNPAGQAIYEKDMGDIAVLSIPYGDSRAQLYLEGLGGNFSDRSLHHGYWIAPGTGPCSAVIAGPDNLASTNWGRVTLSFDGPAFPTGWTALLGSCLNEPDQVFRASLDY